MGAFQRRVTLQVARLRTRVSTLSFIWMLFIPSWKAVWTLARLEGLRRSLCPPLGWMGRHSLLLYLLHQPAIYGVLTLLSFAGVLG